MAAAAFAGRSCLWGALNDWLFDDGCYTLEEYLRDLALDLAMGPLGKAVAGKIIGAMGRAAGHIPPGAMKTVANGTDNVATGAAARAASWGSSNSAKLGKALSEAGFTRTGMVDAHHIVASGARAAAPARAALKKWGIGVNEASNGVWLPRNLASPNPMGSAVHQTVHTTDYYNAVNRLIGQARSREEAMQALDHIRNKLLSGSWP